MEKINFATVIERASGWTHQVKIDVSDFADVEDTNKEFVIGEGLLAGDLVRDAAFYLKVPFAGPEPPPPPPEPEVEVARAKGEPAPGPFGGQVVRHPHEPQPSGAEPVLLEDPDLTEPKVGKEEAEAEEAEAEPKTEETVATSLILDVGHRESKDQTQEDTSLLQGYQLIGEETAVIAGNANGTQFNAPPAGYAVKKSVEVFATFTASGGPLKSLTQGEVWIYLNVTRLPGVY